MTEVILDDAPMYGEVIFDRNRMQSQIDNLEEKLTQANRIHEGLVNDKEEQWESKNKDLQRRLDAELERTNTLEKYVGVIRHAWKEITTEEFPKMGGWKLDPEVDPTSFGYILKEGTYHKIEDLTVGSLYVANTKGTLLPVGAAHNEGTPEPVSYNLILDDD